MLRWVDENAPDQYVDWYPFDHPQLGPVELGGWHDLGIWTNPPPARLRDEVAAHAQFAVAPGARRRRACAIRHHRVVDLGAGTWRVEVGVANTGWLPTYVSVRARKENLVLPIVAELGGDGVAVVGGPARIQTRSARRPGGDPVLARQRRHARPGAGLVGRAARRPDRSSP